MVEGIIGDDHCSLSKDDAAKQDGCYWYLLPIQFLVRCSRPKKLIIWIVFTNIDSQNLAPQTKWIMQNKRSLIF